MPDNNWITRPSCLDQVDLRITTSVAAGISYTTVWAQGRCDRRRTALWSHTETYQTIGIGYDPAEAVRQVVDVAMSRKPRTQTEFDRALNGELWDQPGLFDSLD